MGAACLAQPPGHPGGCSALPGMPLAFGTGGVLAQNGPVKEARVSAEGGDGFRAELVQLLPQLRRFAVSLTRNLADGDDLVQAVCERAITRRDLYTPGEPLQRWLYTMMRNLWISEIRKQKVRMGEGQEDAAESAALSTDTGGFSVTAGNQVMDMVLSLPEGLASVLLLVSVEGHSYREAAEILNIPIGTVMSRMSTARQRLKARLGEF